ncbi:MAG: hypothetical protein ABI585_15550 [Betaproteobacteria bacterium]
MKRARDSTVSEVILPLRRARRRPAAPDAATVAVRRAPTHWIARSLWATVAGAVLVAGGIWIVQTRGIAGTIAPRYAVSPTDSGTETLRAAASPTPAGVPDTAVTAPQIVSSADAEPHAIDARSLPSSIALPRNEHADTANAALPAPPPPPEPVVAAPLPPPVVVAQAPAARPAPDRWQRLSDSLARCATGDTWKQVVCEETLRIEHCEGFFGRVAACPARVEREYGN